MILPACRTINFSSGSSVPSSTALRSATFRATFPDTGASKADLRTVAGMPPSTFHRALNELVRAGALVNTSTGQRPFYELPEDL